MTPTPTLHTLPTLHTSPTGLTITARFEHGEAPV
jgi:hypothetical protein